MTSSRNEWHARQRKYVYLLKTDGHGLYVGHHDCRDLEMGYLQTLEVISKAAAVMTRYQLLSKQKLNEANMDFTSGAMLINSLLKQSARTRRCRNPAATRMLQRGMHGCCTNRNDPISCAEANGIYIVQQRDDGGLT